MPSSTDVGVSLGARIVGRVGLFAAPDGTGSPWVRLSGLLSEQHFRACFGAQNPAYTNPRSLFLDARWEFPGSAARRAVRVKTRTVLRFPGREGPRPARRPG